MKLLVVEDEPRMAALLSRGLSELGYAVDVAVDGVEGLWRVRTELELARMPGRGTAELCDAIDHTAGEVRRLSDLAEDLLLLAGADADAGGELPRDRECSDASAIAFEALRAHRAVAATAGVHLDLRGDPGAPWPIEPPALRRVLDNLLGNALTHTPPGGEVVVELTGSAGGVALSVSNSGPGFPAPFLAHAFERFRRADSARSVQGGGRGLGLAIVAEIARLSGGSVAAVNRTGGGARVVLRLPRRDRIPESRAP